MANIITGLRILFSILMLCFPVFSIGFYILYLLCGFTDVIDGIIARQTNTVSRFGVRFDTAADFIFVAIALIKLLPPMNISRLLLVWVLAIAAIKIANAVLGFIYMGKFIAEHTVMNKITGVFLFLLPFTMSFIEIKYSAAAICFIATLSAFQEGYFIITGRETE